MIWLDGEVIGPDIPAVKGHDRGLLLGDGIFETILSIDRHLCFFTRHMSRLRQSAALLDIKIPYGDADLLAGAARLFEHAAPADGRGAIRLTLTRGVGPRGLLPPPPDQQLPTVMMSLAAAPSQEGTQRRGCSAPVSAPPIRAMVSTFTRNEKNPTSGIKTLGYLDHQLARMAAKTTGAEEAILCNTRGDVACSTVGNIFLITEGGDLLTPSLASGVLPGITRHAVIENAAACGLHVREGPVSPYLLGENLVFMTNSLMGLRRLSLGGGPVDKGDAPVDKGPAVVLRHFTMLCEAYEQQILDDMGG